MILNDFEVFTVLENAPSHHKYCSSRSQPTDPKRFQKCLRLELKLLSTSLPSGIHVKTFEDRMVRFFFSLNQYIQFQPLIMCFPMKDLFSVLIEGPAKTPYEGGLFFFDFQLPNDYPLSPPTCHYW